MSNIIKKYLSLSKTEEKPEFIIVLGPLCAGKTTYIKENFNKNYIIIDAVEIYKELNSGDISGFGVKKQKELDEIGEQILKDGLKLRKNIVIEFTMEYRKEIQAIAKIIKTLNYKTIALGLDCSFEEGKERDKKREDGNISSYFTDIYHLKWLLAAVN